MTPAQPVSRRHHIIPVMLLQNFVDPSGKLWVGDTDRGRLYSSTPRNAFVHKDLYNRRSYVQQSDGPSERRSLGAIVLSDEYERHLAQIESAAAPVIADIFASARNGECPRLSESKEGDFKRFMLAMARRTPEAQHRVSRGRGTPDLVYDVIRDFLDRRGIPGLPSRERFMADPAMREYADVILRNSDALFAAGTQDLAKEDEIRFCRETSLRIAVITMLGRSFVVGSHGMTIMSANQFSEEAESWLPIAADVAVQPWFSAHSVTLITLGREDDHFIDRINRATAECSVMIAGRSEKLVESLVQAARRGGRRADS